MKKISVTLLLTLILSPWIMAQRALIPAQLFQGVTQVAPKGTAGTQGHGPVSGTRSVSTDFYLDYALSDIIYGSNLGVQSSFFEWPVNKDYDVTYIPNNSINIDDNFTLKWGGVLFDTIYDYDSEISYPLYSAQMTVDTIFVDYRHVNQSGNNDTVRVSLYKAIQYNFNTGIFSGSPVWADTIISNTTITEGVVNTNGYYTLVLPVDTSGGANPGYAIPRGGYFAVRVDYAGSKMDTFNLIGYAHDECGGSCLVGQSAFYGQTIQYVNYINIYPPTADTTKLSGAGYLQADCDNSGAIEPDACEVWYLQNYGISAHIRINADFVASGVSDVAAACPGSQITLTASASGATGGVSYLWTGPGLSSPTDQITNATIPAGQASGPLRYYLSVTDDDTTIIDTITINVRSINVNAGADQVLACGATADLLATVSGFTNGQRTKWTTLTGDSLANSVDLTDRTEGSYIVIVTNNAGCSDRDTVRVSYNVGQVLGFNVATIYNGNNDTIILGNSVCVGALVNFVNTSSDLANWAFSWGFGTGDTSTSANASHTYAAPGPDVVTLYADSSGCRLTLSRTLSAVSATSPNCITGIDEAVLANAIKLFPNPTSGIFTVNISGIISQNVTLAVFDLVGKQVYAENKFAVNGGQTKTIDLTKNSNGIYFVRVQVDGSPYTIRVNLSK